MARKKRNPNAIWTYRTGKSQAQLTSAYMERLEASKKAKRTQSSRAVLISKLASIEQENAALKMSNSVLQEELNQLKVRTGSFENYEPFRLQESPPALGELDLNINENSNPQEEFVPVHVQPKKRSQSKPVTASQISIRQTRSKRT